MHKSATGRPVGLLLDFLTNSEFDILKDFYVYELSDYQIYQRLVCNLVEEAYIQENNILLLCENEQSCENLDELLLDI